MYLNPRRALVTALLAAICASATAQIEIPGLPPEVEGTDGDLNITGWHVWYEQDLTLARTGDWTEAGGDVNGDGRGDGIYDPNLHAVVFKYSSVDLSSTGYGGIYYRNHPSRAPVVWLVSGDVTIREQAQLNVEGEASLQGAGFAEPGPGGFRGGRGDVGSTLGSAGFGPGGGDLENGVGYAAGSYGTPGAVAGVNAAAIYGNAFILPLIGGSGASTYTTRGGGGGGGAIMIVCKGTINVGGQGINAKGGDNGQRYGASGSGGAIRLIADTVQGNGPLRADAPTPWDGVRGGDGRIFVQANLISLGDPGAPAYVGTDFNESPYYVWAPPETPMVKPVKLVVDGMDVMIPDDPRASLSFPMADVQFDTQNPVTLHIEAQNVPLDWQVVVRITPKSGDSYAVLADALTGDPTQSTTTATFSLNRGFGAMQVRAYQPTPR